MSRTRHSERIYLDDIQAPKPESALKPTKEPKLSRTHAPADLSPVDWQRGLRASSAASRPSGLKI